VCATCAPGSEQPIAGAERHPWLPGSPRCRGHGSATWLTRVHGAWRVICFVGLTESSVSGPAASALRSTPLPPTPPSRLRAVEYSFSSVTRRRHRGTSPTRPSCCSAYQPSTGGREGVLRAATGVPGVSDCRSIVDVRRCVDCRSPHTACCSAACFLSGTTTWQLTRSYQRASKCRDGAQLKSTQVEQPHSRLPACATRGRADGPACLPAALPPSISVVIQRRWLPQR